MAPRAAARRMEARPASRRLASRAARLASGRLSPPALRHPSRLPKTVPRKCPPLPHAAAPSHEGRAHEAEGNSQLSSALREDLRSRIHQQLILTKGADPFPKELQQTVRSSLVLRGVGLNSGKKEVVRIRPALAGEGRYFVRVPPGTVDGGALAFDSLDRQDLDEEGMEDYLLEHFRVSLMDADDRDEAMGELGLEGVPKAPSAVPRSNPQEPGYVGEPGEVRTPAALGSVSNTAALSTWLGEGRDTVKLVEHLLAALEALGVDNARVEVEGTGEVPILDGCAERWAATIAAAGVVDAYDADGNTAPRMARTYDDVLTVHGEGGAFVSFYPDDKVKLTCGIDKSSQSRAIGKQWFSWAPVEDLHFIESIAPARTFATSYGYQEAVARGYFQGAHLGIVVVGDESYYHNPPLKFYPDECVRHKVLDLIGDISLMAPPGGSGLPVGHIVAYKSTHELHVKFAEALMEAMGARDLVPAPFPKLVPYSPDWEPSREANVSKKFVDDDPLADYSTGIYPAVHDTTDFSHYK